MILLHGTTRQRAESIIANGPDIRYPEPGGVVYDGDFSTYIEGAINYLKSPEEYARGKDRLFPSEGGPVILAMDVPDSVILCAVNPAAPINRGLVQFERDSGIEELLAAWSSIRPTCSIRSLS